MRIVLTAQNERLATAWEAHCGDLEFVSVVRDSIFNIKCDAFVSPANSFGIMNGGIDLAYSKHFGWDLQERLQSEIRTNHSGELLVGVALIVKTGADSPRFLIAAPTMRYPMAIQETVNPYLAARAVLLLWKFGFAPGRSPTPVREQVSSIAFPGLGTGIGGVTPNACARQVREAIDQVLLGRNSYPSDWGEVMQQQERLTGLDLSDR